METLDQNAMEKLSQSITACGVTFYHHCIYDSFQPPDCPPVLCTYLHHCPPVACGTLNPCPTLCRYLCLEHGCLPLYRCQPEFYLKLTEGLKACGGDFYNKCPGFDRIEKVCEFEPAIDASKLKEQVQLERIAKLEAQVKELQAKK